MLPFNLDPENHNTAPTVIALHCSLSSGKQWDQLRTVLAPQAHLIAPDLLGYGASIPFDEPSLHRLETEMEALAEQLLSVPAPFHLVGHSYGGAVAFLIASDSAYRSRIASLTLIEPVLPSVLSTYDSETYALFAKDALSVCRSLWRKEPDRALRFFLEMWNGPGCWDMLSLSKRQSMLNRCNKLASDFIAIFGCDRVTEKAKAMTIPTLLVAGIQSKATTMTIVNRLASALPNSRVKRVIGAGHMAPISHANTVNELIARHIGSQQAAVAAA